MLNIVSASAQGEISIEEIRMRKISTMQYLFKHIF